MKLTKTQLKLWGVAAFAIGSLFIGVVWQTILDRSRTIERAGQDLGQLAKHLEVSAAATFNAAVLLSDHISTITLGNLDNNGDPTPDARTHWIDVLSGQPFVSSVAFIRPDGVVPFILIRTSDGQIRSLEQRMDVSTRDAFLVHLEEVDSSLFIGSPWLGEELGRWLIPVTRSIRDSNGELLGVVHVGISLDTFLELFANVLPKGISNVAIYHEDGRVVFSFPFSEELLSRSAAERDLFKTHLPESPFGTYQAESPVGGDIRILSYRAIDRVPAVLAVDTSLTNVLVAWRQRGLIYGLAALGASLGILALTVWLARQIRQDEKTRKSLLISERSLETSQRMAGIGYFERSVRGDHYVWAENMCRIHGVSPETFEPSRDAFLELVVEGDRERLADMVHQDDRSPDEGRFECRIRRPDGEIRNIAYEWQFINDRDGSPITVFGIAQDITDLKETESTVRESEQRLRDITECISDFIWEGDEKRVVTLFDSGSRNVKLDVVVGETGDENVDHDAGGGDWDELVLAAARKESYRNLVIPFRNKEGETRWIRMSGNPRYDKEGNFVGYRGAGSDVTEQRMQHITNMEAAKSEALARLASGMAHEINNILQPVVVYSSMGESAGKEEGRVREYFQKIYAATEQAMRIVKDVLTFAREGRETPAPVSLRSTLLESVDLIRPALPDGLEITMSLGDDEIEVGAHSGGLQRVIVNLMRNAADAAGPDGTLEIDMGTIQLQPDDAHNRNLLPGRYGYFTVSDDGPGISDQDLIKIFDPFFTTKPIGEGTGLGLSVVSGLVQEWGGAVVAESRPGKTVFTVYMPVFKAVRQAAE